MILHKVHHLITYDCNLRCKHCYVSGGEQKVKPYEFTQEEIDRFYMEFKPENISVSGGEPLLRLDLLKKVATSANLCKSNFEVVTSGFSLTQRVCEEIKELNPGVSYQISIDGDETYHNQNRCNPLAYQRAIASIKRVADSNATVNVRMTINDDNISTIPSVIETLEGINSNGYVKLILKPVLPLGRARDNGMILSQKKLNDLRNMPMLSKRIGIIVSEEVSKCTCGVRHITITPTGEVSPCPFFQFDTKFSMGNIFKENLPALKPLKEFLEYKGTCYARDLLRRKNETPIP